MSCSEKIVALSLVLAYTAASLAQESATPPQPAPRPPAAAEAEQVPDSPPAAERPDVDTDEFIPTEELNPDAAVTFPVDI